jgi:transcriptional regulator with XRE-family HTH domain
MHARDKIAKWLSDTGMSQEDAAEAIGMYGQSNVSQYIRGKIKEPGWPWMIAVARAMNCSLEWLMDESSEYPMVPRTSSSQPLTEYERDALALVRQVDAAIGPGAAVLRLLKADEVRGDRPAESEAVPGSSPSPPSKRRA